MTGADGGPDGEAGDWRSGGGSNRRRRERRGALDARMCDRIVSGLVRWARNGSSPPERAGDGGRMGSCEDGERGGTEKGRDSTGSMERRGRRPRRGTGDVGGEPPERGLERGAVEGRTGRSRLRQGTDVRRDGERLSVGRRDGIGGFVREGGEGGGTEHSAGMGRG